ncbi:hypothetical protein ABZY31_25135 [Streptomyces sp. NPDC006529]|uniref:hypothetical protein n=1 Tax=Streptomyces sp. NPDC006529 TaxID=3157177 RepID=UPI00339E0AC3
MSRERGDGGTGASTAGADAGAAAATGAAAPARPGAAAQRPGPRRRTAWTVAAALSAVFIVAPAAWKAWSHRSAESGVLRGDSGGFTVTALQIDAGDAAVTVSPRGDQRVAYRADLRWSLARPEIEVSRLGGTLRLTPRCPGAGGVLDAGGGCGVDLGVTVPVGIPVTVTGGSGKVDISGLGGAVDVRTDSGAVRLTALRGPLRAVVGSGALEATALTSPEADLRAGSGMVDARFLAPPDRLAARTGSGRIALTLPVATRFRVTSRAGSGRLDVAPGMADPAAPGTLDLSTESGRAAACYP